MNRANSEVRVLDNTVPSLFNEEGRTTTENIIIAKYNSEEVSRVHIK